jgi:hypothetical protein
MLKAVLLYERLQPLSARCHIENHLGSVKRTQDVWISDVKLSLEISAAPLEYLLAPVRPDA